MLAREENQLLTQTGPGTPCGAMLRSYWQPVALSEELPAAAAPLPLKIMGEELVLFRDEQGRVGLVALHCPHRGADLSYGRIEDGGLRCIYHGWLFDVRGRCLDRPGEPDGGRHNETVQTRAYPCLEKSGLIFAYMGKGEPPLFPAYEIFAVPETHRFSCKVLSECNYLQGNEGNIDPVHLGFLHRITDEELAGSGRPDPYRRVRGGDGSVGALLGKTAAPTVEVEVKDFGLRIYSWRAVGSERAYLRVSNFVMPNLSAVPGETQGAGYLVNWHVPIDDEHHWKFMIVFSRESPLDKELFRRRYDDEIGSDYRPTRRQANRYLQSREEMNGRSYSGLGAFFPAHDLFATETQGAVQDRTRENLVSSDKAIVAARKLLVKAIQDAGRERDPLHVVRDARANRFGHMVVLSEVVSSAIDWKQHTAKSEAGMKA